MIDSNTDHTKRYSRNIVRRESGVRDKDSEKHNKKKRERFSSPLKDPITDQTKRYSINIERRESGVRDKDSERDKKEGKVW